MEVKKLGLGDFSGATSAQGSQQSSSSYGYTNASGASGTDAAAARAFSAEQATLAYNRQKELMQMQMEFNRDEAQKQRDYEADMANSIYTRSVANMKEAGINPILAANMGLSGASVGSGATASISGASAPMAQSFMDSWSAQSSKGEQFGESQGSSWGQSESGLATGLTMMGELIGNAISTLNSSGTVNNYMYSLGNKVSNTWDDLKEMMIKNLPKDVVNLLGLSVDKSSESASKTGAATRKKTITGTYNFGNGGHTGGGHKFYPEEQ